MDSRAPSAPDAPEAPTPLAVPAGRKPKAKAPLPPAEIKSMDITSAEESVDPTAANMEQNENMIDKDIDLLVVLPGDVIKSTTVHGSKPMMDLLIFLCAQYHLNPSSHAIELLSAEKNHIKFKPNTPIGMLEVEKVIVKPKMQDKKKPTPIIPEKTVRVVINFKKTQKAIVRVSPHAPLQELVPVICSKCEFDPLHTLLLKEYQSQEPLDLTQSLNDLGLRELYAMDISRESCQVSPILDLMKEKENKGFFSFFQRSKKKREQTASAPATPIVSKHRPPSFTRSNTISKPYVSNTLPSDAPKKRRAPLPPMPTPEPEGPASRTARSTSVDDTEKRSSDSGMVRTGSLPLSSTSSGNSSLKRTKRKAPAPPAKTLHQSDENGPVAGNGTHPVTTPQSADGVAPDTASEASSREGLSSPAGVSSDYSLEEIEEKEELSEVPRDEAENVSLKSPNIPSISTDIANTQENDLDSALGLSDGEASQSSKGNTPEARNTDAQGSHGTVHEARNEDMVADTVRNLKSLTSNQENVENEITVSSKDTEDTVTRTESNMESKAPKKDVDVAADRFSSLAASTRADNVTNANKDHSSVSSVPNQAPSQSSSEKTKMQDAAIQASFEPSLNNFNGSHQDHSRPDLKVAESMQTANSNRSTQHSPLSLQESTLTSREFRSQATLMPSQERTDIKEPVCAYGSNGLPSPMDETDKHSTASYLKNFPLYKQDNSPKPKPSNEITRDYIPKIGMTTYKIVPPKSLDVSKDWDSETSKDDSKLHAAAQTHTLENVKDTGMQTEAVVTSEGPREPQADVIPKPGVRTDRPLHRTVSLSDGTKTHPLNPPRTTRDTGTIPFAPNLEDINNILESKFRSRASNPQAKPSSFFLQMQKRASGQYVTSAAARSSHTAPAAKEPTSKGAEGDPLPPAEQIPSPLSERTPSETRPHAVETDGEMVSPKPAAASPPPVAPKPAPVAVEASPPPVAPKPAPLPAVVSLPPVAPKPALPPAEACAPPVAPKPAPPLGSQAATLNLKTLKTFGAPRPYSTSGPSPFAMAVVKRSQSFSKTRSPSSEESPAQPSINAEDGKTCAVNKSALTPQHDEMDKQSKSAHNEQNSETPTPTGCPALTLTRQSSVTFQSSDPEHIRQSLLTAIRSGEAAAKLKRVAVPVNTISVNGKSGPSHAVTSSAQDDG